MNYGKNCGYQSAEYSSVSSVDFDNERSWVIFISRFPLVITYSSRSKYLKLFIVDFKKKKVFCNRVEALHPLEALCFSPLSAQPIGKSGRECSSNFFRYDPVCTANFFCEPQRLKFSHLIQACNAQIRDVKSGKNILQLPMRPLAAPRLKIGVK